MDVPFSLATVTELFALFKVKFFYHLWSGDLMRILWFHQQKEPDCSIVRAIDVQKIWNEKYTGSCLMPANEWLQQNALTL